MKPIIFPVAYILTFFILTIGVKVRRELRAGLYTNFHEPVPQPSFP